MYERAKPAGWIDSWGGPTAFAYGVGRGIYRTIHADKDVISQIIPADIVSNMIIATGWKTALDNLKSSAKNEISTPVYASSTGLINPVTLKGFFDNIRDNCRKYPLSKYFTPFGDPKLS